ncbi:MAG: protein vraC, partial [Staphylococcus epidermidis]|nr:protein vraC [Staphylococcus epidermidis]
MQLYLKDGMEIREVQFTNEEVQNYCELLNIKYDHYVPTLMCAKLWPQFEL